MSNFKIGDLVEVLDPGLLMLRNLMGKKAKNNHHGKIAEIMKNGDILVEFKLSGKNHSQVVPYSPDMVRLRTIKK